MSKIEIVPIDILQSNPYRNLSSYPWVENKIDSLMRSIMDVGLWEGVIVRRAAKAFQLAFGHHRIEAAKRLGLKEVSVIVRDLDDEMMIKMMGRENGEDYSTQFLILLNTWEGGLKYFAHARKNAEPLDNARVLGWTKKAGDYDKLDHTARACNAAYSLISGGHMDRADLAELSVSAAEKIVERTLSNVQILERQ